MRRYQVNCMAFNIVSGQVELTERQAKVRLHNLRALGNGVYEVVNPLQFKRGELLGWSGKPGKSGDLICLDLNPEPIPASPVLDPGELLAPSPAPEPEKPKGKKGKNK